MKKTLILGLAILLLGGLLMTACEFQQNGIVFPSVLEEFDLEEFTEAFFENNTLILVPLEWPHVLSDYLHFYTVFAENGKLNFLIEVTHPYGGGDAAIDYRVFAIVIPNEIFGKHEIGKMIVFETYDFSVRDLHGNPIKRNCREWLNEIQEKSVEHRVGYAWSGWNPNIVIWPFRDHPARLLRNKITVISSVENLQEYFIAGATE